MELVCEKGIGRTHAKWSPVCTAYYRNLPDIRFTGQPIVNEEAEELKRVCPMGVFDIEDLGKKGKKAANVADDEISESDEEKDKAVMGGMDEDEIAEIKRAK